MKTWPRYVSSERGRDCVCEDPIPFQRSFITRILSVLVTSVLDAEGRNCVCVRSGIYLEKHVTMM